MLYYWSFVGWWAGLVGLKRFSCVVRYGHCHRRAMSRLSVRPSAAAMDAAAMVDFKLLHLDATSESHGRLAGCWLPLL